MKCRAKVLKIQGNQMAIKYDSGRFRVGDIINIKKGAIRSLAQNSFYWVYLNWVINNGGKDKGHFSVEGLHLNVKQYFLAEKKMDKGQFKAIEEATTTQLNKVEFGEYMESVDMLINGVLEIDTSPFWDLHREEYQL